MVASSEIERFCDDLVTTYKPKRIILFGSYARGDARTDSDVDLLVTLPDGTGGAAVAAGMIKNLKPRFSVDLIVKPEAEFQRRVHQRDFFLTEALQQGRVIYEAPDR
jgi:predicted nucleotidyltransferase